jgi:dTDP-glucose 4,6-dehydratase
MLELASEIIRLTNSKSEVIFLPLPLDDPRDREPEVTKAREILNWEPKISREEGLKRTIEDVRRQIYSI